MAYGFEPVDPKVSFEAQLKEDTGTVVLINTIVVPDELIARPFLAEKLAVEGVRAA
jgi:hypothetical protein